MLVEQAIFTSAKTARFAGYQLISRSPGIHDEDAQHLSTWGPSHGALLEERYAEGSVNLDRLPSGKYCISTTVAAGEEYSQRGGPLIYTQCLIVSPNDFLKFGNNPFAILRAAEAKGAIQVQTDFSRPTAPFQIIGRARLVDPGSIQRVFCEVGRSRFGELLHAAQQSQCLALTGPESPREVFEALLNCLPLSLRADIAFSSGLRFSPKRPYRWVSVPGDSAEQHRLIRQFGVTIVDLGNPPASGLVLSHGLNAILDAVEQADWNRLETLLREADPGPAKPKSDYQPIVGAQGAGRNAHARKDEPNTEKRTPVPHPVCVSAVLVEDGSARPTSKPSSALGTLCRDLQHKLEQLDDAVHGAIEGNGYSQQRVNVLWRELSSSLEPQLLQRSREQYLQYAINLWSQCLNDGLRSPERAVSALDVLSVLFHDS